MELTPWGKPCCIARILEECCSKFVYQSSQVSVDRQVNVVERHSTGPRQTLGRHSVNAEWDWWCVLSHIQFFGNISCVRFFSIWLCSIMFEGLNTFTLGFCRLDTTKTIIYTSNSIMAHIISSEMILLSRSDLIELLSSVYVSIFILNIKYTLSTWLY